MHCIYLTKDLFFSSRVCSLARERNVDVKVVPTVEAARHSLTADVRLVILDLSQLGVKVVDAVAELRQAQPDVAIIAYGPHVDEAIMATARGAGCDDVLPRSRFDQQIVTILETALTPDES